MELKELVEQMEERLRVIEQRVLRDGESKKPTLLDPDEKIPEMALRFFTVSMAEAKKALSGRLVPIPTGDDVFRIQDDVLVTLVWRKDEVTIRMQVRQGLKTAISTRVFGRDQWESLSVIGWIQSALDTLYQEGLMKIAQQRWEEKDRL